MEKKISQPSFSPDFYLKKTNSPLELIKKDPPIEISEMIKKKVVLKKKKPRIVYFMDSISSKKSLIVLSEMLRRKGFDRTL